MPYLDKEEKFYDYRTSEVDGDNIFDLNKASNSDAQQLLDGSDYWRNEKNTYSEIVEMTPYEYFEACARDCFDEPTERLIQSRRRDSNTLNHLKEVIQKYKRRFPIAYIDYATHYTPSQEGLHRMMVAGDLIGWDKKFPVQIIKWVDDNRAKEEKEWKHKKEIERYLDRAVDRALRYKYYNIEEFKDQLYSEFETEVRYIDEFEDRNFELELVDSGDKEDPGFIAIIDKKYEAFVDLSRIQWIPKPDETDSDDLEDIDLSDIDLSDWMKDFLDKKESLTEGQESYDLVNNQLIDAIKEQFGDDYASKPLEREVCEFVLNKVHKGQIWDKAVLVCKENNSSYSLDVINEDKSYCIIIYKEQLYDYTSAQFDKFGFTKSKSPVRVLNKDFELSKAFDLEVYRDNDYIICM